MPARRLIAAAAWLAAHRRDARDATLFLAGLALALNEGFREHVDRPALLFLAGVMMGLPAFLRANGK